MRASRAGEQLSTEQSPTERQRAAQQRAGNPWLATAGIRPGRIRPRWIRAAGAMLLAVACALAAPGGVAAAAPDAGSAPDAGGTLPVEPVVWDKCPGGVLPSLPPGWRTRFTCAMHQVPLDYRDPEAGTVKLAMLRRAADDPEHRIGSLFINPGGPGASGLLWPIWLDGALPAEITSRFDLIGFDPRGVGRSAPLRCFATWPEAYAVFDRIVDVPVTDAEVASTLQANSDYAAACATRGRPVLDHMSTLDVARDLDRMRQAVGDERLNFLGYSYGSLIGATYVNLFPRRTRAIVLDGNVDPALRTRDGLEYLRQRAVGQEAVVDDFLELCGSVGERCVFAAGGDPAAKFAEIRQRLHQGPIELPVFGSINLSQFATGVANGLYLAAEYPSLADALQQIYQAIHPDPAAGAPEPAPQLRSESALAAFVRAAGTTTGLLDQRPVPASAPGVGSADGESTTDSAYNADDSSLGVNCTDEPFPRHLAPYLRAADRWGDRLPTVGRWHAFSQVACASWPVERPQRYAGPFDRRTATPVLLFGNYHDPATNYRFNLRMAAELGRARLVSVDAYGHTVLGAGLSSCADAAATRYLVDLVVPARGTVCAADQQPFG